VGYGRHRWLPPKALLAFSGSKDDEIFSRADNEVLTTCFSALPKIHEALYALDAALFAALLDLHGVPDPTAEPVKLS
jgi:hypothetical protein